MISLTNYKRFARPAIMVVAFMLASCGDNQQAASPAPASEVTPVTTGEISVGHAVAGPFAAGFYLARVESISDSNATICFAHVDKEETYPLTELRALKIRTWAVGDTVLAAAHHEVYSGKFFEGRVIAIPSPGMYTIDVGLQGFSPMDVEAKYIIVP